MAVAAAGAEVRQPQAFELAQPFDLGPQLGLGARIEHVEHEAALSLRRLARAQLVHDRERRDLPHRGVGPRPVEVQFVLAVDLVQFVFGQAEVGEPVDEVGREHLGLAVERITGEPDQFLLGEADGARMIELGAQFALVDDLGEADMLGAVDDRKGDALIRIEFADHLQHQQLVKIGIEQAAHDRVEPPAVVIGPGCNIGNCHGGTLPCRGPPNQWVLAGDMAAQRAIPAGFGRPPPGYRSRPACPGRIAAADKRPVPRPGRRSGCP